VFQVVPEEQWLSQREYQPLPREKGRWDSLLDRLEAGDIVAVPLDGREARHIVMAVTKAARYRHPDFKVSRRYSSDAVFFKKQDS
jgi:hypothetical protein